MANDPPLKNPCKRLGDILIEEGVITPGQLEEALLVKAESRGFLGKILVELRYISESTLITFLVKQFKIPHINLLDYSIPEEVLKTVPREICENYGVIPIDRLGTILTVAMVDPLDVRALDKVREFCPDLRIKPILCSWKHYEQVLRRLFPPPAQEVSADTVETFGLSPLSPSQKKKAPSRAQPREDVAPIPLATIESDAPSSPARRPAPTRSPVVHKRPEPSEEEKALGEELLSLIEQNIKEAVHLAVGSIAERIHDLVSASAVNPNISGPNLIDAVRKTLTEAMDEASGTLLYYTQQALEQSEKAASTLSAQQLSDLLRLTMHRAFHEALLQVFRQEFKVLSQDK